MKKLIAFFEIPAVDFNRAVKFYESVLGIKLDAMDFGSEKMAFFPKEDNLYPGAISWAKNFEPSKKGVLISLWVDDMKQALSNVEINNGKVVRSKTKIESEGRGYFSVIVDSEGNSVGLYSDQ